jgi:GT2 family glycosyltransferase
MENIAAENHAVLIATAGRAGVLAETLASVGRQTPPPGTVVVVYADKHDLPDRGTAGCDGVTFVRGRSGLTCQRNDGIAALPANTRLVTFLDDDIELAPDYLERCREFLNRHPEVVAVTGILLADGKITRASARQLLQESVLSPPSSEYWSAYGLYGCNMTFRREVVEKERFDERLRLYGFMEDYDFSVRSMRHGNAVTLGTCRAAHLAEPSGRISNRRRGFAQIMNSAYLTKKGVITRREFWRDCVLKTMLRNNLIGALVATGDHRARRERLRGNVDAIFYLLRGRIEPELVEKIK